MPVHQYQLTDTNGTVRVCNDDASSLTLPMNGNGTVEAVDSAGSFEVKELVIYYIDNARDFTLTVTGTNPTVCSVLLRVLSGSGPSYSHTVMSESELVLTFGGQATNGSEALWQFSNTTPPLHVKVRVKRQTNVISCPS